MRGGTPRAPFVGAPPPGGSGRPWRIPPGSLEVVLGLSIVGPWVVEGRLGDRVRDSWLLAARQYDGPAVAPERSDLTDQSVS
jgi:hypothetical protein